MRWMKHMTNTRRDERVAAFLDKYGCEGYGMYWSVLETIAEHMDPKHDKTEAAYSILRWSKLLNCHRHKVDKYLRGLHHHGLVTLKIDGDQWLVCSPNLLKYVNEYQKKSARSQKKDRLDSSSETESESEREKHSHTKVDAPANAGECFEKFWEAYPRKHNREQAIRNWINLAPSPDLQTIILGSLDRFKESREWEREQGRYIPSPDDWLADEAWKDLRINPPLNGLRKKPKMVF